MRERGDQGEKGVMRTDRRGEKQESNLRRERRAGVGRGNIYCRPKVRLSKKKTQVIPKRPQKVKQIGSKQNRFTKRGTNQRIGHAGKSSLWSPDQEKKVDLKIVA